MIMGSHGVILVEFNGLLSYNGLGFKKCPLGYCRLFVVQTPPSNAQADWYLGQVFRLQEHYGRSTR
jgi:hypothetical protein